jgi:hypothetical protein
VRTNILKVSTPTIATKGAHPTDDFPSEAEDSEGLISSDAESVTPTTKQMFAEVSKFTREQDV